VLEVPITVARTHFPDKGPLKHLEISALSFTELCSALRAAHREGLRHVVLMFHSFSTVKARDFSYNQFRPDRLTIRRLRRLLGFLAQNPSTFRVRTFGQLARGEVAVAVSDEGEPLPDLGRIRPLLRKAAQAVNRVYWI